MTSACWIRMSRCTQEPRSNNPVRVLDHPNGVEVLFMFRQIELTDEEYVRDLDMVADGLKRLVES